VDQDEFCERMWPRLVAACVSYTGSTPLGEDLAQEALTRALVRWKRISTMDAPEAFVMTIAMNLARSHWRRRRIERRFATSGGLAMGTRASSPHDLVAAQVDVRAALLELAERQWMAVVLRFQADLSVAQTARVMGCAEGTVKALTHRGSSFDAAVAILTVHHWHDLDRGLAEMKRVARRQIIFTWDPEFRPELWIVSDYVPAIGVMERARFTSLEHVIEVLDAHTVQPFEIPHDFTDGFQAAYWRRPEAYLDPEIRAASSTFAVLAAEEVEPGIERLRRDLASGEWTRRFRDLLDVASLDYGYRVITAG
jgi:RNA polymerase sigma factor (sigma-70 family)